jgi:hypothetical protein
MGLTFERVAAGRFHKRTELSPFGHMDTRVIMRSAGDQTEITYERTWEYGLLRPPIPSRLYRRAWNSLFDSWTDALERALAKRTEG